jgi:uncharacterized coiled-coil DUF342 family protein
MTPTPRTEAQRFDPVHHFDQGGSSYGQMKRSPDGDYVPVELAFNLECENARLRETCEQHRAYAHMMQEQRSQIADYCRTLEKQIAELLAANAELITVGAELSATADELRAENAELLAENNRLCQQLHALRLVCGTTDANKFQTRLDRALMEVEEQARLLGMSGEREARLIAEVAELRKDKARLESNYYDVADVITRESSGVEDLCKQARELRKDMVRLDWLADPKNTIGNVSLPRQHIMDHPDSMRAAIDAAMEAGK